MKLLDRYVAKNFLIGYLISFSVLIGLCIVIDLFVNVDEFAENVSDLGLAALAMNILKFYGARVAVWFRDLAGMITVIAAVFSLARMTRNNELTAVMASGMSLKRILAPILFLALLLTALLGINQEAVIPNLTDQLTRSHDDMPGQRSYDLWFVGDSYGNLVSTQRFDEHDQVMIHPFIILRNKDPQTGRWTVYARIDAQRAEYDADRKGWKLLGGTQLNVPQDPDQIGISARRHEVKFIESDLTPYEIPLRRQEGYKALLSSMQLEALIQSPSTRQTDKAELYLQKHTRVTDPIMNLIMLMVALPVLVCRDPKNMKSAILISFILTTLCFLVTFLCKLFATEVIFNQVRPEIWAWVPIFIFLPIAFLQIDSMKT